MTDPSPHTLQCLEVWGGNQAADNGVVMPGLDAWVYAQPFKGTDRGGDIHYLSSCATGRIVRLLIADVAGHGDTVATLSERLRNLMRRYMNYADQRRLVGDINREFTGVADVGRFATAIVATCWTPSQRLSITNAGHPPPLLYSARANTWSLLADSDASAMPKTEPRNIPLGIAPADYDEHRIRLADNDILLFYSDAIIEARSPDHRLLGFDGLIRLLNSLDSTDPKALITNLRAAIREHDQRDDDDDDLTIMALRPNALRPRGSVLTGLRAGSRLAGDLARSLKPGAARFARPEITIRNIAGSFIDRLNRRD